MRLTRTVVNTLLNNTLPCVDQAPEELLERVFRGIRWMILRAGFPLPPKIDPRFIRNTIRIIADAVVRTPYGQPLVLQYPLLVTLSGSTYCPFRCTNCYSDSGTHRMTTPRNLSWTPWHDAVARSPVPLVFLTGGEPMADPGIEETAARLLSAGKWVCISSNASIAKLLELNKRHPHSLFFYLPLWGQSAQHDELRGPGSFRRLCENLRMLTDNGLSAFLLVVMSDNDLGVIDTVSELAERYRISLVRINRKVSVGRVDAAHTSASESFIDSLRQKTRSLRRRVDAVSIDIPEARAYARHSALLRWLGIPAFPSCSAGQWMMHLDDHGRAYPCYTFEGTPHYHDLPQQSLEQMWSSVRRGRETLGFSDACVGEAYSQRTPSRDLAADSKTPALN